MDKEYQRREYDEEPVYYCRSCHSLKILVDETLANDDWDGSYCAVCHSADIDTCTIDEWLEEEEKRRKKREELEWRK